MFKSLHGVEAMKRLAVATNYSGEVQAVTQSPRKQVATQQEESLFAPASTSMTDKHQVPHHNRDNSDQKGVESMRSGNRSPVKAFGHTVGDSNMVKALTESNLNQFELQNRNAGTIAYDANRK